MIELGYFRLTTMFVRWTADDDEEFSRVVYVDGNRVIRDQKFTDNIFSGEARSEFTRAIDDILGNHSRSMISGYSQHPEKH